MRSHNPLHYPCRFCEAVPGKFCTTSVRLKADFHSVRVKAMFAELRPQPRAREILMTCPNCGSPVKTHPRNDCVLNALIGVLHDRGNLSKKKLHAIHRKADTGVLWEDLGPILDRLEEGFYTPGD